MNNALYPTVALIIKVSGIFMSDRSTAANFLDIHLEVADLQDNYK